MIRRAAHALAHLPGLRRLAGAAAEVRRGARLARSPFLHGHPPGHFYSPIPDLAAVEAAAARLWPAGVRAVPGVDLHAAGQLALLDRLGPLAAEAPFPEAPGGAGRYHFDNVFFRHHDALALYGMLRLLRPRRVVEVGSGFSSAVMLDTDERFLGGQTAFTFVEPYPERLYTLLRPADRARCAVLVQPVQDVDPAVFEALEADDVLFIDSSHVAKVGSDVNHLFFEVLPRLRPGVVVHVHDVGWPFEYPRAWLREGRAWNEAYLVRAFLQYNAAWRIEYFNAYLAAVHPDRLAARMPAALRDPGGSLWLRRVA